MRVILFLLILLISIGLFSQNSEIYGKLSYNTNKDPVGYTAVYIYDSIGFPVKSVITDSLGVYKITELKEGEYKIALPYVSFIDKYEVRGIRLKEKEKLELNLFIKDPCVKIKMDSICPYCNKHNKVLKNSKGLVVNYNFGENNRVAKRYYKKINKLGYLIYKNHNSEVFIINVFIEGEREKFWDGCHKWFCTRCKKVF